MGLALASVCAVLSVCDISAAACIATLLHFVWGFYPSCILFKLLQQLPYLLYACSCVHCKIAALFVGVFCTSCFLPEQLLKLWQQVPFPLYACTTTVAALTVVGCMRCTGTTAFAAHAQQHLLQAACA